MEIFSSERSVRDILDACLYSVKRKNPHSNLSVDSFVDYLHSEWLYTLDDLRLGDIFN